MAPARFKSLAEHVAELEVPFQDYDPENQPSSEDENSDTGAKEPAGGREHYQTIGKSKLRKRDLPPLDSQYEGSRVSRVDALEEEEDDPFARGFDIESSDEEDGYYDNKTQNHGLQASRASLNGFEEEDDDEGAEDNGDGVDPKVLVGKDDDSESPVSSDENEDDEMDEDKENEIDHDPRAELRRMMNEEQKLVTKSISQAAKADAEKGLAVKQQRSTFNSLLNSRIRLQKALVSTNSVPLSNHSKVDVRENNSVIEAAESAAFKLWSSLNSLRQDLKVTQSGQKRKHRSFDLSTPSQDLWNHMQYHEADFISHRNSVLNKWAAKTRTTTMASNISRLDRSAVRDETMADILASHLTEMPRLIKRARTPRSCAPLQSSLANSVSNPDDSRAIYDDADLYSLLLKSLLEQTSADIDTSALAIPNQWQLARQAKTKKVVDSKASKGRKMRYTVHEKLQNFMAPEDRSSWGDRQRDELFGGLLGTRGNLAEKELVEEEDQDEIDELDFKLFG